jgi:hypothetical protein
MSVRVLAATQSISGAAADRFEILPSAGGGRNAEQAEQARQLSPLAGDA